MKKFSYKIKDLLLFKEPLKDNSFALTENPTETIKNNSRQTNNTEANGGINKVSLKVNKSLALNLRYLKEKYTVPLSSDVLIREFQVNIGNNFVNAFLIFLDGMVDKKIINDNILKPLMLIAKREGNPSNPNIVNILKNALIINDQLTVTQEYDVLIKEINFGACALFVDNIDLAFVMDVKGFENRSLGKPENELVIRGPQEGFNENLRTNTSLIRKRLKDEDLIVENISIGKRSNTSCAMLYIKDIANNSLVEEVRKRLTSISVDYINDSSEIEQYIEDSSFLPAPQMTSTERPDRAAYLLSDGRVAILVNGSPYCLLLPITFYDLTHSIEDMYTRFPGGNLLRLIRFIGVFCSLLLPGFYIAITNYHQEMIPTGLLLAIEASREKVPFPSIVEILIMEISFELIREAGIRIPGPIGPTLGIIGALILGQAAVAANIVSPILIIIVSLTGIGSFSIPDFTLAFSFRVLRFIYIVLAVSSGFLGIATGLFIHGLFLVNAKSFGVPFLSPYAPRTSPYKNNELYRKPVWKQEKRPDYLNPKDMTREPPISRGWYKSRKTKS